MQETTNLNNNYTDKSSSPTITTVSFFAGCGGLDLGFTGDFNFLGESYPRLPFNIVKAYEKDLKCIETYKRNVNPHIVQADLSTFSPSAMPKADLLIGGFPCQEFSPCGPKGGLEAHRGQLYRAFVNYMKQHTPHVVVAENVPNLERMQQGAVLETIRTDLENITEKLKYRVEIWRLTAVDYGVPQARTRLFIICVRDDLPGYPILPPATHSLNPRSIDWAVKDLEEILDESVPNQSQYFLAAKAKNGNGQGDEKNRVGEPAYTIRANAKSRVQFHYELDRRLTVRECARIQTFPDTFTFPHSATTNIMQIGNAVPPILAYHVAKSISEYFASIQQVIVHAAEREENVGFSPKYNSY